VVEVETGIQLGADIVGAGQWLFCPVARSMRSPILAHAVMS
jgi:hypothetical protein